MGSTPYIGWPDQFARARASLGFGGILGQFARHGLVKMLSNVLERLIAANGES